MITQRFGNTIMGLKHDTIIFNCISNLLVAGSCDRPLFLDQERSFLLKQRKDL